MNIVKTVKNMVEIRNVLISVYDKTNLKYIVENLLNINSDIKIFSTGGTYQFLKDNFRNAENFIEISDYTGHNEMQGGLVKTLDFKLYLGILSELYNVDHQHDIKTNNAVEFDMIICNLYPFETVVSESKNNCEDARGNIDIGGVTLIRAASKNYLRVACVSEPKDYKKIVDELEKNKGQISLETRFSLSKKSFLYIKNYDTAIENYFNKIQLNEVTAVYEIT